MFFMLAFTLAFKLLIGCCLALYLFLYLSDVLHEVFVLASVICCFHLAATFTLLMFVHQPSSEILLLWSSFTLVFLSYDLSSDIHGYFISSLRDIH